MSTTYNDPVALYNQVGFIYDQSVVVIDRTATGAGTGTETAVGLITRSRTATGSGTSTSNNSIVVGFLRTAQGSGGASTGDQALINLIPVRTATGSGTGASTVTGVVVRFRTATGAGQGAATATRLVVGIRTATGSGTGASVAIKAQFVVRTATGSGTSAQSAIGNELLPRAATGSGVGTDTPAIWIKSRIFRVPPDDDYPFSERLGTSAADRLFSHTPQGVRARNLYKLTDGTYSLTDPRRPERVVKVYYGGHNIFLEDSEVAELTAAGYGAYIT